MSRRDTWDPQEMYRFFFRKSEGRHHCYYCYDSGLYYEIEDIRLDLPLEGYYHAAADSDAGIPTLYRRCSRCGALPRPEEDMVAMTPDDVRAWLIERRTAYFVLYTPLTHEAFKGSRWLARMAGR